MEGVTCLALQWGDCMSGQAKTKALLRLEIPPSILEENPDNPNEMSPGEFDLLVQNLEESGFTENAVVAPRDLNGVLYLKELIKQFKKDWPAIWQQMTADGQKLRIMSGHHRVKAAIFLGFDTIPCVLVLDESLDEDQQDFQLIRMNVIKGKLTPSKFMTLYKRHEKKYGAEMMASLFGFADQEVLDKLIAETEKTLPDDMKQKFKEAAAEIKTVDELSKLLNKLFSTYGDTLPQGFMFLDYGGQESVWVRVSKKTMKAVHVVGDQCVHEGRSLDDVLGALVQLIANGKAEELMKQIVATTPPKEMPKNFKGLPTQETLDNAAEVA